MGMTLRSAALFVTSLSVLFIVACQSPIGHGDGRVSGLAGAAPARPLGNDIAPAPGKTVKFLASENGHTESTTTGSDGHYSIDLRPGTYEVRLQGHSPLQLYFGRNPNTYGQWPKVTVTAGEETKLDLIYDSGIR